MQKNRIAAVREEIRRLLSPDVDFARRDDFISSLRDEVAALQTQLRLADVRSHDPTMHLRDGHETVRPISPSIWKTPRTQQSRLSPCLVSFFYFK